MNPSRAIFDAKMRLGMPLPWEGYLLRWHCLSRLTEDARAEWSGWEAPRYLHVFRKHLNYGYALSVSICGKVKMNHTNTCCSPAKWIPHRLCHLCAEKMAIA